MRKNVRKLEALLLAGAMAVTTAGCMPTSKSQDSAGGQSAQESSTAPVSYTHLTLPTT